MSVFSNQENTSLLPNLPGFRGKDVHTGAKKQFFQFVGGQVFMKDEYLPQNTGLEQGSLASTFSRPKIKTSMENANIVLTFSAYFEEKSSFSSAPIDEKRVRKVNICYFVENSNVQIVEKPQMNSGMPQGTLVRKSVVLKSDGTPILPEDFHIGEPIEIFGRKYVITDCDNATRKYMSRFYDFDDSARVAAPIDPYEAYRKTLEMGPSDDWNKYRSKKNQNKEFMEAQLGNTVNNQGREGFIKYGQQTLKFRCVWDNTSMLYGDLQEFTLAYYLCDDTIEIFGIPSSGVGNQFTKLLKRSKLPRNLGNMVVGERDEDSACYNWRDLYIGLEMNVYCRKLRIVDADRVTRSFYEEHGVPLDAAETADMYQSSSRLSISKKDSAEDAAAAMPRKYGENKMLAFFASLLSGGPDDASRKFVISFYLQNGTVQIMEPPIRNSGFAGGLFLSRRVVKMENGEPLSEKHLYVGAKLKLLNHRFLLLESNESTLRWMEDQKLPRANFYHIMDKIRPVLYNDAVSGALNRQFRSLENSPSFATIDALRQVFSNYGLVGESDDQISEHELITILRANGNKSAVFNYEKVVAQIVSPTDEFK